MWDGKHYSFPFNKTTYLLFYNKGLLEKRGVKPPNNWNELAAAAEKLTFKDNGRDIVGLALNASVAIDGSFWVAQAGGVIYDEATDTIKFNEQPGVEAMEFLAGMVRAGHAKVCKEEKYITGPFTRGDAAMAVCYMYELPNIIAGCKENGIDFDTVVVPHGKEKAALFTGTDVTLFNTSTPEQKLAAFTFLKFFYEPENQFKWGTLSGFLPMNFSILNGEKFRIYCAAHDPAKLTAAETFDYGTCDPKILNGYAIHANMAKAFDRIVLEAADAKTALDEAAEQARKEIQQARNSFQAIK